MYYSPHTLFVKNTPQPSYDEHGNPVFDDGGYVRQGMCRCDDTAVDEMTDENGHVFRPSYKIVAEKPISVSCGDFVRVMDGDSVRGEGKVRNISKCNYYRYVVLWV